MTTTTTLPVDIAADLRLHGIDPAAVEYSDARTRMGNGATTVRLPGKPVRVAVYWSPYFGGWGLKVSGRYVEDAAGEVRLFASAGQALSWEGGTEGE